MGNQLVGVAPSQIYPVEHYLSDHVDLSFDQRYDKLIQIQNLRCLLCSKIFILKLILISKTLYKGTNNVYLNDVGLE